MRPEPKALTTEQRIYVQVRGYRTFIRNLDDGGQELITVPDDSTLVEYATRPDRWSTWSRPVLFQEIAE
jgi:hypothetical protein